MGSANLRLTDFGIRRLGFLDLRLADLGTVPRNAQATEVWRIQRTIGTIGAARQTVPDPFNLLLNLSNLISGERATRFFANFAVFAG